MTNRSEHWIQTYTGKRFDLMWPTADMVDVFDMARSLAFQCRFNGAVRHYYSVAQHCVLVSLLVPPELALAGLLHDGEEAYLGDIVRPMKLLINGRTNGMLKRHSEWVNAAIGERFDIDPSLFQHPAVMDADNRMLLHEKAVLLAPAPDVWTEQNAQDPSAVPADIAIVPMSPLVAEYAFLERFFQLCPRHYPKVGLAPP